MSWWTPGGEITLKGREAAEIRDLIGYMYEQIDGRYAEDIEYPTSIRLFGNLEKPQQLALLLEVGSALLKEDCPAPKRAAVREATVAAIYDALYTLTDIEIDGERMGMDACPLRRGILEIVLSLVDQDYLEYYPLPNASCQDMERWGGLIETMKLHVLGDEDWDMEDDFVDHAPDKAMHLKDSMRIADDYYTDVAPDPTEDELEEIRTKLTYLTGSSPRRPMSQTKRQVRRKRESLRNYSKPGKDRQAMPICRFTPPQWEGHGDEAGYYTTDIVTEEPLLLVATDPCEEDEEKLAALEKEAQKLWDEKYASQMVPVDPDENVEIKVCSNINADYESSVTATTGFAVVRMTLYHATKHTSYCHDGLGNHGAADMHYAFVEAYSNNDEIFGVTPVDILWVDDIESDDLEGNRNRIADLLIHLRDDFVCDGIVAMEQAKFFAFLPGFEKIEKYLYYGDFMELQKSRKHRPMR